MSQSNMEYLPQTLTDMLNGRQKYKDKNKKIK